MSGIMSMLLGAVSSAAAAVDEFFNRVTLLLPGNGTNGAQNNTFLDSSSNNFTITRNGGNPGMTQGTFSPFSQTGWSNFFDGSSRLDFPTTSTYQLGSSDFTYETWVYVTASGFNPTIYWNANTSGYAALAVRINSAAGNPINLSISTNGSSWASTADYSTTNLNAWNHIAVVRNGTNIKLYLNGNDITSGGITVSGSLMTTYTLNQLAAYNSTSYRLTGYLSNTRLVIGAALYTSNFTPSTSPLTTTSQGATAAQTEILTCKSNRFIDNSDNGAAITVNGTPSVQAFSPFAPGVEYSAATVGGSGYFDGTGDYLSVVDNVALQFGSGNFTINCWIYRSAIGAVHTIASKGAATPTGWVFQVNASNQLVWTDTSTSITTTTTTIPANTWTYVSVVRSGTGTNQTVLYINGASSATGTSATNFNQTSSLNIGADRSNANTFNGYIAGIEYVKGTALSISVPTAPPTTTNSPSLLLNYTNAGITDATAKNVLETVGNAQISTTQSKFGGSSIFFNGSVTALTTPALTPAYLFQSNSDWTIEFWFYTGTSTGTMGIFDTYFTNASPFSGLIIQMINGTISVYDGSSNRATTTTYANSTWHHFAWVNSAGTSRIYINGSNVTIGGVTSWTTPSNIFRANAPIQIGRDYAPNYFTGYIDDLRVTKAARYTANFTAPTSAFPLQ